MILVRGQTANSILYGNTYKRLHEQEEIADLRKWPIDPSLVRLENHFEHLINPENGLKRPATYLFGARDWIVYSYTAMPKSWTNTGNSSPCRNNSTFSQDMLSLIISSFHAGVPPKSSPCDFIINIDNTNVLHPANHKQISFPAAELAIVEQFSTSDSDAQWFLLEDPSECLSEPSGTLQVALYQGQQPRGLVITHEE